MRALVVFESYFGNTKRIAEAVAEGLSARLTVDIDEVTDAPPTVGADVDLVVVGGPTHAFGLTRPTTRADAVRQAGGTETATGIGLREWLDKLPAARPGTAAACFDTRVSRPRVPGSAARRARSRLREHGFTALDPATTFWVRGTPGPLVDGELERAREWGVLLAQRLAELRPVG
ncbi:flavodoxin family protein [Pseudonocardia asaccharolytica]|uniref:flavodoxin family protein n=1 Tax=Pseudonocardia asaccharolytica TaxID=54010 RepID=UPI000565D9FA|nr:flavodoxin family protein [Pseudonocardia asaccharolytica]